MFSIILVIYDPNDTYSQSGIVDELIDGVFRLKGNYELIIANNSPESSRILRMDLCERARSKPIKIVDRKKNLGTSGGFNAGFSVSDKSAEYCVFMSNDAVLVDQDILLKMDEVFRKCSRLGIAHPFSVFEDNNEYNINKKYGYSEFKRAIKNGGNANGIEPNSEATRELVEQVGKRRCRVKNFRSFPLTFAVMRRSLLDEIGLFDEGVVYGCHENNDLAFRALVAGYSVGRLDCAFVNHKRISVRQLSLKRGERLGVSPHLGIIDQSTDWWNKKYGRPYGHLYLTWKYGWFVGVIVAPYFILKERLCRVRKGGVD